VFFGLLILASLVICAGRSAPCGKLTAANPALLLFYVYFALSALWSFHPTDSLVRIVKDFGLTVLPALVLLSDRRPSEAIRAVYFRCASVAFPLSMLYTRYYQFGRSYSRDGSLMYTGITTQKNTLGNLVIVYVFFLLWDYFESRSGPRDRIWMKKWWGHLALLLIGTRLLILAQSATSYLGAAVALTLLVGSSWWLTSRVMRVAVLGAALSMPVLMVCVQEFVPVFAPILSALGRDTTLTGRTELWQGVRSSNVNPWIGAGFWNFWNTRTGMGISKALGGDDERLTPSAHNGFLEVFIDGGLIGVAAASLLVLSATGQILRALPRRDFQIARFIILVVTLVSNLAESYFARPSALWFSTVLVLLNYPFHRTVSSGIRTSGVSTETAEDRGAPRARGLGTHAHHVL